MLLFQSGVNLLFLLILAQIAAAAPNDLVLQDFATPKSQIGWFGPYDINQTPYADAQEYWVAEISPENYSLVVGDGIVRNAAVMEKVFFVHELSRVATREVRLLSVFSDLVSKTCWLASRTVSFINRIFIPWTFGLLKVLVLRIGSVFIPADILSLDAQVLELGEFLTANQLDISENTLTVISLSSEAEAALAELNERKDYGSAERFMNLSDAVIVSSFSVLQSGKSQNVYQANKTVQLVGEGSRILKKYNFPGAGSVNFDAASVQKSVEDSDRLMTGLLDKIAEKSRSLSKVPPARAAASAEKAMKILSRGTAG